MPFIAFAGDVNNRLLRGLSAIRIVVLPKSYRVIADGAARAYSPPLL